MSDIAAWLSEHGLAKYIDAFRENDVALDVLPSLSEADLKELGMSLGDRKRLLRAIASAPVDTPKPASRPEAAPAAERRQLSVAFVDLVSSTALSRLLDPEDFRDLLQAYHQTVAAAIRDGGGFLAKFMGDGVLAYFGYPTASEDAAERAVRAALQAVEAVAEMPAHRGHKLEARAGVATGPVVVGDVVGEDVAREVNVVGETPNLAARLLGVGNPGQVVVAGSTRRLVGELFAFEDLGPQSIKGISEPVAAFRVLGERQGLSRFEAIRRSQHSTLVGRGQEVGLLLDRWQQAKAADGQLALLSGEAGIGKSRICEILWQAVDEGGSCLRVRYQCTPQHTNSVLYPAITHLIGLADLQADLEPALKVARVRAAMPDLSEDQLTLIASLVGVPVPTDATLVDLTPARRRRLLLDGFAEQLLAHCRARPVLWMVEDAHWIDPTTEELLSLVIDRISSERLMIVVTHRPEYRAPWAGTSIATQLSLNRLSRSHATALLQGVAASKALPAELVEYVVARSDGVPLYMEELFQALTESGAVREGKDAFEIVRPLMEAEVPSSLQDSLMARLDRLAPAKSVAQLGAAIGREFHRELISSVADMPPDALAEGLDQLLTAGLIFSRGSASDAAYAFKHALIQEAAYGSMLRARRQQVHARIARTLVERSGVERPELIAHHFEAAGDRHQASRWLEKAGDTAMRAAAAQEAIRFWRQALSLAADEDDALSRHWRIEMMQKLASALLQVEGYASAEAFELGEAALCLARDARNPELYLRICISRSPTLFSRQAFDMVERDLMALSDAEVEQLGVQAQARWWCLRGIVHVHMARVDAAQHALGKVYDLGDGFETDSSFGGGDVRFVARGYLAGNDFIGGFPDRALRRADEALQIATAINHAFSMAWANVTKGRVLVRAGRHVEAIAVLDEAIEICERFGYVARHGYALVTRGSAKAALGQVAEGVEEIDRGIGIWRRTAGTFSLDLSMLEAANVLMQVGQPTLAQPYLDQATSFYETGMERVGYAEYFRLDGRRLAAGGDRSAAMTRLREAIAVAEQQGAQLFRLRASHDLASLIAKSGDKESARTLLLPVYGWFTEGFGTQDLLAARQLLDELNA